MKGLKIKMPERKMVCIKLSSQFVCIHNIVTDNIDACAGGIDAGVGGTGEVEGVGWGTGGLEVGIQVG